jgi:hypothetical protein
MSFARVLSTFAFLATSALTSAVFAGQYPLGPDPRLTPGALCTTPTEYRYAEHIPYCRRDVQGQVKHDVFVQYDVQLGYQTQMLDRQTFKVDHYIPLCMGGANSETNLWPQHNDVYTLTDPIEPLACGKMAQGVLSQAKAIEYVRRAKNDLSQVNAVIAELNAL